MKKSGKFHVKASNYLNYDSEENKTVRNIPLISHLPTTAPAVAKSFSELFLQMTTAGTQKDCIQFRRLPYEADVEHILKFLGDHSQSIAYQGVQIVYNAQVIDFFEN